MSICIPVDEDRGLDSSVCGHFGSAPYFLMVDVASGSCHAIPNANHQHEHGRCSPLAMLQGQQLDGLVVGGIGMGALNKLEAAGVPVFAARHATVRATVAALVAGTLRRVSRENACAGHGHHD